jgi:hypothetical protein
MIAVFYELFHLFFARTYLNIPIGPGSTIRKLRTKWRAVGQRGRTADLLQSDWTAGTVDEGTGGCL